MILMSDDRLKYNDITFIFINPKEKQHILL